MRNRPLTYASFILAACAGLAAAAEGDDPAPKVPVTAKKEITIGARNDADVQLRELYYSRLDGASWGAWEKYGLDFAPQTPIVWPPTEGHWRIYVRIILIGGAAMPVPDVKMVNSPETPFTELIVDRTPPAATLQFPPSQFKLRGGTKYTLKWDASDTNLGAAPVTLKWARSGASFETVVEKLPNTGSYEWLVPRDMTTTGTLRLEVADLAGNIGIADSNQLLVDSIAPRGEVTGPAITGQLQNTLALSVRDDGPAGLQSVQLLISQDNGLTWSEGPTITEPPFKSIDWKAPRDGRFLLALQAIDKAGNVSAPPPKAKGPPWFELLIDTQPPVITLTSATGLTDAANPAAPPQRAFKPKDRVQVQFLAKDPNIAENSVAVYMQTDPAKPWKELAKGLPSDSAYRFEIPAEATRAGRIKVTAMDLAGNIGETLAAETFIIFTKVDAGTGPVIDLK